MGEYIMTLIGAGVLCSMSEIIAPEKWAKYIRLFTGVIIAILIISPIKEIDISIFEDIAYTADEINDDLLKSTVKTELEKRIAEDIEQRIMDTFKCKSYAETSVTLNSEGQIEGVESIYVKANVDEIQLKKLLCNIYGITEEQVKINGR